jgi:hypothetical protein
MSNRYLVHRGRKILRGGCPLARPTEERRSAHDTGTARPRTVVTRRRRTPLGRRRRGAPRPAVQHRPAARELFGADPVVQRTASPASSDTSKPVTRAEEVLDGWIGADPGAPRSSARMCPVTRVRQRALRKPKAPSMCRSSRSRSRARSSEQVHKGAQDWIEPGLTESHPPDCTDECPGHRAQRHGGLEHSRRTCNASLRAFYSRPTIAKPPLRQDTEASARVGSDGQPLGRLGRSRRRTHARSPAANARGVDAPGIGAASVSRDRPGDSQAQRARRSAQVCAGVDRVVDDCVHDHGPLGGYPLAVFDVASVGPITTQTSTAPIASAIA